MAKDPAFLFYSNDFLTGTQFFTDEQTGKYIKMLATQHQIGHLTENQMIHICKTYDKDVFAKFEKDSEGLYYNERLELEVVKRKKYSESRSKNKKGKKHTSKSHDNHIEDEDENDNTVFNNTYTVFYEKAKNLFPTANDERRMMIAKKLAQRYSLDEVNDIDALVRKYMLSKN
jgi:hypothetical protein